REVGMRWAIIVSGVLMLGLLAGCGGGGAGARALAVTPNELRLSYFHWTVGTVAGAGGQEAEFFEIFAKLAMPRGAPVYANMKLALPELPRPLGMAGPLALAPGDGISDEAVPVHVYWGAGDAAPAHQPLIVRPGDWLPGYAPPGDVYFYSGHADLDGPVALATAPGVTAADGFARSYTLPAGEMLPIPRITYPAAPVFNTARPGRIAWAEMPGAAGYLVIVEGDVLGADNALGRRVVWTSAARPILFEALYDPTADLLPAHAREVIIPAGIFTPCKAVQVSVFAQAAPATDAAGAPTLKRVNAAMGTYVFATFQL
ncbi:MAG TPA: hypothetical protein PK794_08485, partial [Armatimonadota bacterium]|nr:hypothetical protein [Armatimonadota bacterium]